jgi:hypothetical protein
MRQTISGLVAAFAVVAASAVPAMACGGLFQGGCSPCGQAYVPCAQPQVYVQPPVYVAPIQPTYYGCNSCGWAYERLADPVEQYHVTTAPQQYYYADQGPTYSGPGNFAPYPVYRESGVSQPPYYGYGAHRHHYHAWHPHTGYGYGYHHHAMHHTYGYREHVLRRYY